MANKRKEDVYMEEKFDRGMFYNSIPESVVQEYCYSYSGFLDLNHMIDEAEEYYNEGKISEPSYENYRCCRDNALYDLTPVEDFKEALEEKFKDVYNAENLIDELTNLLRQDWTLPVNAEDSDFVIYINMAIVARYIRKVEKEGTNKALIPLVYNYFKVEVEPYTEVSYYDILGIIATFVPADELPEAIKLAIDKED